MERAEVIVEFRKLKREQKIKENAELVNKELLEFEKVLNKYKHNTDDRNGYMTLPIIIKTDEVKNLLKENGYIIDKVSNDIEYGTTRIFLDEKEYEANLKLNYIDKKMKENHNVKIKLEPPTNNNTSLNNRQRKFLEEQEYYPLKEDYFDLIGTIANILKEKKESVNNEGKLFNNFDREFL
jgi:hypothetical protein